MRRPVLRNPLINCIRVAHAAVTPRTDGDKVVNRRLATLALRNVVPAFVVKDRNLVPTPGHATLAAERMSHPRNPDLFGKRFGDLLLLVRFAGEIAELHWILSLIHI